MKRAGLRVSPRYNEITINRQEITEHKTPPPKYEDFDTVHVEKERVNESTPKT